MKVRNGIIFFGVVLLVGCAVSPAKKAERYASQDQWLKAVVEAREAQRKSPDDVEVRSMLKQYELRAAEFYYQQGLSALADRDVDTAIGQFEQGLMAMPKHEKLQTALKDAVSRKEAEKLFRQALRNIEARNVRDATSQLEQVLEKYPGFEEARSTLESLKKQKSKGAEKEFALTSNAPITLNFKQTDLRTAFGFLADSFGINVIFDEGVKDKEVTLFAKDVTFRQALSLMLTTSKTFYKKVGENTILIAADTKEKRGQYDDYLIRTFYLSNANAKEIADLLKGVISLQKVVINERLNTIAVRDTPEVLKLVEDVIAVNDEKPAEMILDVEILEVNRTEAERLGFNWGSTISSKFPEYPISGSIADTLNAGQVILPSVTFNYFKQKVNGKTLANPKIRTVNGRQAKILIGDRVPLRMATTNAAEGLTTTSYEYTDIGVRLTVEPNIYMDNSTLVKIALEVSSLGSNLGTEAEPAYSIGTRNAETYMLLDDGETAILGGLIRDEDRRTRVMVPGLGEIPIAGMLFSSKEDSVARTDVLLTITPRVIRPWSVAPDDITTLYSGTADTYSINPRISNGKEAREASFSSARAALKPALPARLQWPLLEFKEDAVKAPSGGEVVVDLQARYLRTGGNIPTEVLYDAKNLEFIDWQPAARVASAKPDSRTKGVLKFDVNYGDSTEDAPIPLGQLRFRLKEPGSSFIMLGKTAVIYASGERKTAKVRNVRVVAE